MVDSDIVDFDTSTPQFSPDVTGAYILFLVVDDGIDTSFDAVLVRVNNANSAPTADAGSNQTVSTSTTVTLDAGASSDADGDPLTFTWTLTSPVSYTHLTLPTKA